MTYFLEVYNERIDEINRLLDTMKFLEEKEFMRTERKSAYDEFFSSEAYTILPFNDFINILKSNISLMLYNIIEYTISGLIDRIYESITNEELSYIDLNDKIKSLWHTTMIKNDPTSSFSTLRKKSEEIISLIVERKVVKLKARDTLPGGNLDGCKILRTLEAHGINDINKNHYRPTILEFIKKTRNELAHGGVSFVGAMKDKSMNDIITDKQIIIDFLNDVINDVKQYRDAQRYKTSC